MLFSRFRQRGLAAALLVAVVLVLFVLLPPLGDANRVAKQHLFAFATLVLSLPVLMGGRVRLPRAAALVALPLATFSLSALQAHHSPTAWLGCAVLACAILYLLLVVHVASSAPSLFERFADVLLVAGGIVSLLGIYQYVDYLRFGVAGDMVIPWLLPPTWGGRVSGIFYQPNLLALLLVLCLLAALYRALHDSSPLRRRLAWLPVPLLAFTLALTQSRAGLLSLAVVCALLALAHVWRSPRLYLPGRRGGVIFLLVVACSYAAGRALIHFPLGEALSPAVSVVGGGGPVVADAVRGNSDDMRLVFWTSAILIFLDHPLLGVGLDNYKFLLSPTMIRAHDALAVVEYEAMGHNATWAHNEYLQLICEGGVPALGLLAVGLFCFFRSFRRALVSAGHEGGGRILFLHLLLVPFLLQSLFSWPLRYPPLLLIFLTVTGILLTEGKVVVRQVPRPARILLFALVGIALAALGALFSLEARAGAVRRDFAQGATRAEIVENFKEIAYNPFVGYRFSNGGALQALTQRAIREGDGEQGAALVPAAERLAELAGGYWQWYNLALLYHFTGRLVEAHAAVERAIERNPVFEPAWALLHHLNVLEAARATGRPVESFLPQPQLGLESMDAGNSVERGQ